MTYIPTKKEVETLHEIIRDSQKSLSNFVKDAVSTRNLMQEIYCNINESLLDVARTAKNTIDQFSNQILSFQGWIDNNRHIFNDFAKQLSELKKQYNIAEEEAVQVLHKYKWFISPNLPIDFIFEAVKLGQKKGRQDKAINELFYNYLSDNNWQNLEVMILDWEKNIIFKKRIKIIRDCVNALKTNDCNINIVNVVLPTIISQIDGFLSDYLMSKGLTLGSYNDKKTNFRNNATQPLSPKLDNQANDVFLEILFQGSNPGQPLQNPFYFNRHKILHGENTRYGRKDYLIRAFLIIDYLVSLD